MNIFVLDSSVKQSAQYYCDRHVVKIISEITQMCTASLARHNVSPSRFPRTVAGNPLKVTHVNHPITKWVGETSSNYFWATEMLAALCKEYTHRYDRHHHYEQFIGLLQESKNTLPFNGYTAFPPAMPIFYKTDNLVQSYRNYYKMDKVKTIDCRWTKRSIPDWI